MRILVRRSGNTLKMVQVKPEGREDSGNSSGCVVIVDTDVAGMSVSKRRARQVSREGAAPSGEGAE